MDHPSSLTPEARVVLGLGAARVSPGAERDIVALAPGVDWDAMVDAATAEGVAGLASRHLAT